MDPRIVEREPGRPGDLPLARGEEGEREQRRRDDEDVVALPAGSCRGALTSVGHARR